LFSVENGVEIDLQILGIQVPTELMKMKDI